MHLDKWLTSIAYLFLTDRDFQKVCDLANIQWSSLPDFECVRIVRKYLALLASNSHAQALLEINADLTYLERCDVDLQSIGANEEEIGLQLKKYFTAYQYLKLGEALIADPENGTRILNEFDVGRLTSVKIKTVSEFLPHEYDIFLEKQKEGKSRLLIPGFEQLSRMIGGFNFGRVIMVLGETGFGKTNLAINLLIRAATQYKCLFINMEMTLNDITKRLVVLSTQKSFTNLYAGEIPRAKAVENLKAFGDNLKFTDGYSLSLQTIEAIMRKEKEKGLDFVVIDYDQKIDFPYSRSVPEWKMLQSAIIRIEDLSKELEVCVLFMAQVNREGTVSASHRSTFTAHTIINFKALDIPTVYKNANAMIHAEKNRHGKKDSACVVSYNEDNLNINELDVIKYKKPDGVKREKTP